MEIQMIRERREREGGRKNTGWNEGKEIKRSKTCKREEIEKERETKRIKEIESDIKTEEKKNKKVKLREKLTVKYKESGRRVEE